MRQEYYAHTSSSRENEKLLDHLLLTAKLAKVNGSAFHNGKVCEQLGLLHDIGKRTENFQEVLEGTKIKQDHAIVAAIYYFSHGICDDKWLKRRMAAIMAAHHCFLYTMETIKSDSGKHTGAGHKIISEFLESRMDNRYSRNTADSNKEISVKDQEEYKNIKNYVEENHLLVPLGAADHFNVDKMSCNERMLYIRMLLSCLVDADYSSTIEYDAPGYLEKHFYYDRFDAGSLMEKLDRYHEELVLYSEDSMINRLRNQVYASCEKNGALKTGFLTLTAPTGSGKTLALMKFALRQAATFKKNRIIIVLPYLSIINQNAAIYQSIFGEDMVIIDDSQTDFDDETRLYADRWSSPIIVTTSVKFFKTLFASKATELRKLHNICNSVVVFDECQTLSSDILNTTIEALQSLTKHYGTTVLFSTATKPSYAYRNFTKEESVRGEKVKISEMQWEAKEIMYNVQDAFDLYKTIKNTEVSCLTDPPEMMYEQLADYYKKETAAVYIFNTVKHAAKMYDEIIKEYGPEGCYLITSRFCPEDKLYIIDQVNERLKSGKFVRLVATQCVEAGVDFDFPNGAREYAPLDSVIQAAGRVNRNGKYKGKFLVFKCMEHTRYDYPSAGYKEASDITFELAKKSGLDFYDLTIMDEYYKELYNNSLHYRCDSEKLYDSMLVDSYNEVSRNYKVINTDAQITMIVKPIFAYSTEIDKYISEIEENGFTISKQMMKKLSKYTVSVYCSKGKRFTDFGMQLNVRTKSGEHEINWFIANNDVYSTKGLNLNESTNGGVFL